VAKIMSMEDKIRIKIVNELSEKFKKFQRVSLSDFKEEYPKYGVLNYVYPVLMQYAMWHLNYRDISILEYLNTSIEKKKKNGNAKSSLYEHEEARTFILKLIDEKEQELVDNLVITV